MAPLAKVRANYGNASEGSERCASARGQRLYSWTHFFAAPKGQRNNETTFSTQFGEETSIAMVAFCASLITVSAPLPRRRNWRIYRQKFSTRLMALSMRALRDS